MKYYIVSTSFFLLSILSYNNKLGSQQLNQSELVSTRGEHIYISTINLGINGDKQFTIVTNRRITDTESFDKTNSLKGLDPFIYSFSNDTLNLYFRSFIRYKVPFVTKTIKIEYFVLNNTEYMKLYRETIKNDLYHSVPNRVKTNGYPNMPKAPKENSK